MASSNAGVQYTLTFLNNSTLSADFCLFQQDPDLGVSDALPLAWFTKYVLSGQGQQAVFYWSINYSFVWGQTGQLIPGVTFNASQILPADLSTSNQVTLNQVSGAYEFIDQTAGSRNGELYITENGTIQLDTVSVGIGMSGSGTFAVQGEPNMNLVFTPHPQYWCAFGTFTPGEVLDVEEITNTAQISYPPNTYAMYAILNQDNTWTISTTQNVNEILIRERKKDPKVHLKDIDFSKY
jgi:hypothetical protein